MKTFIVRVKENKEIVGIYNASKPGNLPEIIDEILTPSLCEYRRIEGTGGISFPLKAPSIPLTAETEEDIAPAQMELSSDWSGELLKNDRWYPIRDNWNY